MQPNIKQSCDNCGGKLQDGTCFICGSPKPGRILELPIQSGERSNQTIHKSCDMTLEEVRSLYFDENALIESPYRIYRIDSTGSRFYYILDAAGKPELFKSTTSFIKENIPAGPGLINYYKTKTVAEQDRILEESSAYGTLLDICCNQLLINKTFSLDEARLLIKGYLDNNMMFGYDVDTWERFLKKDIMAFAQFIIDYQVEPVAISLPLVSRKRRNAGTLDLVCRMNDRMPTKTIKAKRVLAIVDYKSKIGQFKENGERGSFYQEHELQLHDYKNLLKENFPKIKIKKLFNWSPKNWKTSPTYNLKDQTEAKSAKKLPALYSLLKLSMQEMKISKTIYSGTVEIGKPLDSNINTIGLEELIINRNGEMN